MVDFNDDTNGGQGSDKTPRQGYEPHPLFPREDGSPESRDIQFISFCRRRSDGVIDYSPEDISAGEITSWAPVVGPWGGGEYKAVGKDKTHRVVAWSPEKPAEWLMFDTEPKPFTLREQRDRPSPPGAAAPPASFPPPAFVEAFMIDVIRKDRSSPLSPEAVMLEMITTQEALRMLREQWPCTSRPAAALPAPLAPPALTPVENALLDLVRELRSAPASSTFSMEAVLVTMITSQGELLRKALSAVRPQGMGKTDPKPTAMETALAAQLLHALRGSSPKP